MSTISCASVLLIKSTMKVSVLRGGIGENLLSSFVASMQEAQTEAPFQPCHSNREPCVEIGKYQKNVRAAGAGRMLRCMLLDRCSQVSVGCLQRQRRIKSSSISVGAHR